MVVQKKKQRKVIGTRNLTEAPNLTLDEQEREKRLAAQQVRPTGTPPSSNIPIQELTSRERLKIGEKGLLLREADRLKREAEIRAGQVAKSKKAPTPTEEALQMSLLPELRNLPENIVRQIVQGEAAPTQTVQQISQPQLPQIPTQTPTPTSAPAEEGGFLLTAAQSAAESLQNVFTAPSGEEKFKKALPIMAVGAAAGAAALSLPSLSIGAAVSAGRTAAAALAKNVFTKKGLFGLGAAGTFAKFQLAQTEGRLKDNLSTLSKVNKFVEDGQMNYVEALFWYSEIEADINSDERSIKWAGKISVVNWILGGKDTEREFIIARELLIPQLKIELEAARLKAQSASFGL